MEKKNMCILPLAIFIALSLQNQVNAETITYCESDEIYQTGGISSVSETGTGIQKRYRSAVNALSVEDVIYNALSMDAETIDISSYCITSSELYDSYVNVINGNADLFYVDGRWSYGRDSNGYVTNVYPVYTMEGTERQQAKDIFYQETKDILDNIDDTWSDMEKALYLHDYLCTHYEYDTDYSVYDAYHFLTDKKGVCQAYTITYNYLLKQEKINGKFAQSDTMNHIWNIICLDEEWYHVDVTFDDPLNDMLGRAKHTSFLKSDIAIADSEAGNHKDWITQNKCTDTAYDEAFWNDIEVPFVVGDNQWYCLNREKFSIAECDIDTCSLGKEIYRFTDKWMANSSGYYWTSAYSGLGIYDGKLYFNTPQAICSYDISNAVIQEIFCPEDIGNESFYGLYMDENVIYYALASSPLVSISESGTYMLQKTEKQLTIDIKADKNNVKSGEKVTITADASGGKGPYMYSYLVHNKDSNAWYRFTPSFINSNSYVWTAGEEGNREFFVEVKDCMGTIVRSSAINVTTNNKTLAVVGKTNVSNAVVGDKIIIAAAADGGNGSYTYSYLVHNKDTNQWYRLTSSFVNTNTYTWTAGSPGNREFFIEVKDSTGEVVRSQAVNVKVMASQLFLSVSGKASANQTSVGTKITFTATASGGSGEYTYSYLVHNKDTDEWFRFTSSFIQADTYTWTAGSKGNREFFVEVKDSTGKVVRSQAMNVTVN